MNFRQFAKVKDLDICRILDDISKFPMFMEQIKDTNKTANGLLHSCPYYVRFCLKQKIIHPSLNDYFPVISSFQHDIWKWNRSNEQRYDY